MYELRTDSLDIRLEAFVQHINSQYERYDDGGFGVDPSEDEIRSTGYNSTYVRQYLVPQDVKFHSLSLNSLQNLALYLVEAAIRPELTTPTTLDHFRYWAWTAAIILWTDELRDSDLHIDDFQQTVHLGLLQLRQGQYRDDPYINSIVGYNQRIALLSGFSVLEGFICEGGTHLTTEGKARTNMEQTWMPRRDDGSFPTIGNGDSVNGYHKILQVWKEYDSSSEISSILEDINDITRYDRDTLVWKFGDLVDVISDECDDETHNFLRIVGKHRNFNLHGQKSIEVLSSVVLTLCCLFIWGVLDQETYEDAIDPTLRHIEQMGHTNVLPSWPSAFYPLQLNIE